MNCIYCNNGFVNRKKRSLPRCNKCKAIYYINDDTQKIREIIFFATVNNSEYRIDHKFEDNITIIYEISIEGKFVKMKPVLSTEILNVNPLNADHFFKNKLKLYQLFS